jgi:hypothetical protein
MNKSPRMKISSLVLLIQLTFEGILSYLVIAMFLFSGPAFAQPKISVVGGAAYDWGAIGPGTLHTTMKIVNNGTDTLRVKEIRVSCGCTTAPISKEILVRGDTAILTVSVDLHNKDGEQRKEVYLLTNDPVDSLLPILLKANITRDLVCDPIMFPTLMNILPDKEVSSEIQISNTGRDTLVFAEPYLDCDGVSARFSIHKGDLLSPGDSVKVKVFFKPRIDGYLSCKVMIPSSSKFIRIMAVDLRCYVKEPPGNHASTFKITGQSN